MRIRHLHLPDLSSYAHASRLQTHLYNLHRQHRNAPSSHGPVPPTVITFSPAPIYTTGRRELGTLSPEQIALLKQPLPSRNAARARMGEHAAARNDDAELIADFAEALRGGQTTFHGPGQMVAYPIFDLRTLPPPSVSATSSATCSASLTTPVATKHKYLTPHAYIHALESALIRSLSHYHIPAMRTEHPGVWLNDQVKIAALGVHLRQGVTGDGVALNVRTDLRWFERIVACGLVGKGTGSMEAFLNGQLDAGMRSEEIPGEAASEGHGTCPEVEEVAGVFVEELGKAVCGQDIVEIIQIEEADLGTPDRIGVDT